MERKTLVRVLEIVDGDHDSEHGAGEKLDATVETAVRAFPRLRSVPDTDTTDPTRSSPPRLRGGAPRKTQPHGPGSTQHCPALPGYNACGREPLQVSDHTRTAGRGVSVSPH